MDRLQQIMKTADEVQQLSKDMGVEVDRKFEKFMFKYAMRDGSLSFNEMECLEIGQEVVLDSSYGSNITAIGSVHNVKDEIKASIHFDSYGILIRHLHNDCDEYMKVISGDFRVIIGECIDGLECKRFLMVEGEEYYIPAGVKHQFTNIEGEGILEVIFKKVLI